MARVARVVLCDERGQRKHIMKLWKPLAAIALVPVLAAILAVSGTVAYNFVDEVATAISDSIPASLPYIKPHPVTIQQKASHMLGMADKNGDVIGVCTGTVIGPHAILTADHCDHNEEFPKVKIDYSFQQYDIVLTETDGNEHTILILDGPEFHDIAPYNVRTAKIGEHAYIVGNGGREYPGVRKDGKVIEEYDPSEVDKAAGIAYFDIHWIPGDSGSAIYGLDGSIVALVTFHRGWEGAGFALRFEPHVISLVQNFGKGIDYPVEPVKPTKETK